MRLTSPSRSGTRILPEIRDTWVLLAPSNRPLGGLSRSTSTAGRTTPCSWSTGASPGISSAMHPHQGSLTISGRGSLFSVPRGDGRRRERFFMFDHEICRAWSNGASGWLDDDRTSDSTCCRHQPPRLHRSPGGKGRVLSCLRPAKVQVGICEGCYVRLVREWYSREGVR